MADNLHLAGMVEPYRLPEDGRLIMMETSVLDIDRRIKNGDPTLGWRGDPQMFLVWNGPKRRFEVCGIDAKGNEYVAVTGDPGDMPDARLIQKLVIGDWQHPDRVLAQYHRHLAAQEAAQQRRVDEIIGDGVDRLGHAFRKDFGIRNKWAQFDVGADEEEGGSCST